MKTQSSVLVIDDEQIVCDSCHRILTNENYKVETYTNPKMGYKDAVKNNYDVIILDLIMAELSGLQLLNKLRAKKPDQPVIIITGCPTKASKEKSDGLGVLDYILKPFKPSEIVDPVKNILEKINLSGENQFYQEERLDVFSEWESIKSNYWFYNSGYLHKGQKGYIRVGGQLPVYQNEHVKSIRIPFINDYIYRGLPLAEITLTNDVKHIIPSVVTGRIVEVNTNLVNKPSLFENNKYDENWIASIIPENLKEDLSKAEKRKVIFFGNNLQKQNHYFKLMNKLGNEVNAVESIEQTLDIIKKEGINIVMLDAESLSDSGPEYVKTINEKFPGVRIIVFDKSGSKFETLYRQNKIFYYDVQPVSKYELICILHNAFYYSKVKQITEDYQPTSLPPIINRISITNRHSQKVTLFIYDNICQNNRGIGFTLRNNLLKKSFPVKTKLTWKKTSLNDLDSEQIILNEKEKSDKIILLHNDNLNKIPGTIVKNRESFSNINGSNNSLIRITLQSVNEDIDDKNFDKDTEIAIAELIENEMTTK